VATILIDVNLDGHANLLAMRLATDEWRELRDSVDIQFRNFEEIGLDRSAKDDIVWRLCQEHSHFLLTANRNEESDDSLEATIRKEGTVESLPVLTLANAKRIYQNAAYLDKTVEKLLDILMNQENYRGAGRLFLP
jgi:hypothetical protein